MKYNQVKGNYEAICILKENSKFIFEIGGKKILSNLYKKDKENNCNICTLVPGYKIFYKPKKYLPIYNFQDSFGPISIEELIDYKEISNQAFEKSIKNIIEEIVFDLYCASYIDNQISQEIIEEVENEIIQQILSDLIPKIPLKFCYFSISIPKRENGINDDACFTNERSLGIADGVGGWNEYGIDPSLFSNELMTNSLQIILNLTEPAFLEKHCNLNDTSKDEKPFKNEIFVNDEIEDAKKENEIRKEKENKNEIGKGNDIKNENERGKEKENQDKVNKLNYPQLPNPKDVLIEAYTKCKFYGSATAIMMTINFNQITTVVMGDCRLLHISFDERKANNPFSMKMFTKEMIHENGTPFQFARFPSIDEISQLKSNSPNAQKNLELLEEKILSQRFHQDSVKDCLSYSFLVKELDIVVMGSDGLFDNLYPNELIQIINRIFEKRDSLWKTPQDFVEKCTQTIKNEVNYIMHLKDLGKRQIPYQEKCLITKGKKFFTGKEDDLTIIVGLIIR